MNMLSENHKYLLKLVRKGKEENGWTPVSKILMPLVETISDELVVLESTETGGRIKLTDKGDTVLDWI